MNLQIIKLKRDSNSNKNNNNQINFANFNSKDQNLNNNDDIKKKKKAVNLINPKFRKIRKMGAKFVNKDLDEIKNSSSSSSK